MLHPCLLCKAEKPADEFYKNSNRKTGVHSRCMECCREQAREQGVRRRKDPDWLEYQREWKRNNKDKIRGYYLKRVYGLTKEEFEALPKFCEVCSREEDLCVDHDHDTGQVRGTLCRTCNAGIGLLKDDRDLVERALRYLDADKG